MTFGCSPIRGRQSLVDRPEPCVRVGVAGALPVVGRFRGAKLDLVRARAQFRDAFRPEDPGQTRLEAHRQLQARPRPR